MLLTAIQRILPANQEGESEGVTELRNICEECTKSFSDDAQIIAATENSRVLPTDLLFRVCKILLHAENNPQYLPEKIRESLINAFGQTNYRNCKKLSEVNLLTPVLMNEKPVKDDELAIHWICEVKRQGIDNNKIIRIMFNNPEYTLALQYDFKLLYNMNLHNNDDILNAISKFPRSALPAALYKSTTKNLSDKERLLERMLINHPQHAEALVDTIYILHKSGIDNKEHRQSLYQNINDINGLKKIMKHLKKQRILTKILFEAIIKYYPQTNNKGVDLSSCLTNLTRINQKLIYRKDAYCEYYPRRVTPWADPEPRTFLDYCAFPIIVNTENAIEITQTLVAIYIEKKRGNCTEMCFEFLVKLFSTPVVSMEVLYGALCETITYFKQRYTDTRFHFEDVISELKNQLNYYDFSHVLLGMIFSGNFPVVEGHDKPAISYYHFLQVRDDSILWKRLAVEGLYYLHLMRESNYNIMMESHLKSMREYSPALQEDGNNSKNADLFDKVVIDEEIITQDDKYQAQQLENFVEREQMLTWLAERNSELGQRFSMYRNVMRNGPMFFPLATRLEEDMVVDVSRPVPRDISFRKKDLPLAIELKKEARPSVVTRGRS